MEQTPTEYMKQRELTLNLKITHTLWLKQDVMRMNTVFAGNNAFFNNRSLEKFLPSRITLLVWYCNKCVMQ